MLHPLLFIGAVPQYDVYNCLPSSFKDTTAQTIVQSIQTLSSYLSF